MRTSKLVLVLGTMLAAAAPALVYAQAAPAAEAPAGGNAASAVDDAGSIIVTARRVEERLQDVPISITVYNQQQLQNKNIVSATDLATYTPSLSANSNFGSDNTTFAIRGFAQDIGTAPSVGTYFGDVVTPRGASNGQPVGDGASAGDFFDLANVQVLKGPQGTLFGRNTTGGAVLFVPQKPTGKLEGYVMGGYGNYNQRRVQAVINIPLADTFRVRLGVDRQLRDGYLHNISGIGPSRFNNLDYWAGRASIVGDLTPNLENYVIASYSQSKNNGSMGKLVAAVPADGLFGVLSAAQIAEQGKNFYNVENPLPNAGLKTTQWQVINTTTWKASDSLTVKNIASYAQITQTGVSPIFGIAWKVPVNGATYISNFQEAAAPQGEDIAHESTFTDEFRLAGSTSDSRLNWQTGAYLEVVRPLSQVGAQSPGFATCANGSNDPNQCTGAVSSYLLGGGSGISPPPAFGPFIFANPLAAPAFVSSVNYTLGRTSFHDVGLYAQATYKLAEQFKVTGGIRYTWDREAIDTVQRNVTLNLAPMTGALATSCTNPLAVYPGCLTNYRTESKKPTWLIDFDYTPSHDLLVYAKYARGYRSAAIVPNIPEGGTAANPDTTLNYVKPEKVDAYEAGIKSSFGGALHGIFDVALFYNKFSNQQLQVGFLPKLAGYPETAAPVNAGKSKIYGAEVEASVSPFHGLNLTAGYTYLRTRIDQVSAPPSNAAYNTQNAFVVGDPEVLSPRNKLALGANYTLPLDSSVGKITVGGTMTYRSSMLSNYIDRSNPDPAISSFGILPSLTLFDASANWTNVAGAPIDLGFFVTNLTKKKYYTFSSGLGSPQLGFETAQVGDPRFFGGTVKVHF